MDPKEMEKKFGSVTFEGREYILAEVAQADNYGTEGAVRYYADAVGPDGEDVRVVWDTTVAWDLAQERARLENDSFLTPEEEERLDELEVMVLPDVSDESNACDWGHPVAVGFK